jgi:hypothetical protein
MQGGTFHAEMSCCRRHIATGLLQGRRQLAAFVNSNKRVPGVPSLIA